MTDLDDVRKVFETDDITGVVIALGGKTADVGKTMLTDGNSCPANAHRANSLFHWSCDGGVDLLCHVRVICDECRWRKCSSYSGKVYGVSSDCIASNCNK